MAGGAMLASATMMVRVALIAAAVRPSLLALLLLPLFAAAVVTGIAGLVLVARGGPHGDDDDDPEITLGNPLDLASVLKFGALLTVIGMVAHIATRFAGSTGAYLLAALSGIADVDAITLSLARLAGEGLDERVAGLAVLIATTVNTASKALIGWVTGGARFGQWMALLATVAIAAGAAAYAAGPVPIEQLLLIGQPR